MRAFPLILALLAAPAVAQDGSEGVALRTVEGAQQFLTEFYGQGERRAHAGGYTLNGNWTLDKLPGSTLQMIDGPFADFQSTGRCASRITIYPAMNLRLFLGEAIMPIQANSGRIVLDIDWSAVTGVSLTDDFYYGPGGSPTYYTGFKNVMVALKTAHDDTAIYFVHGKKTEADRAAFAMQFLAEQCGFKTETGF